MVDLYWTRQWQLAAVVSLSKSFAQTNKSLARRPEQIDGQDESLACWLGPGRVYLVGNRASFLCTEAPMLAPSGRRAGTLHQPTPPTPGRSQPLGWPPSGSLKVQRQRRTLGLSRRAA